MPAQTLDSLRSLPDSLALLRDTTRALDDSLRHGTGDVQRDILLPLAVIAVTLGLFSILFFVRSK